MSLSIFTPKRSAKKGMREGRGGPFWKNFWEQFQNANNYSIKINQIKNSVANILSSLPEDDNKKIYIDISLDESISSKSSSPSRVWKSTDFDIVETANWNKITVSGKKRSLRKLEQFLQDSSYELAKTGEGISKKNMNIYRELFTISSLNNRTTSLNKRLDHFLRHLFAEEYDGMIKCIIELYSDELFSKYDDYFDEIKKYVDEQKIQRRDTELFIHNMSYIGELTIEDIKVVLTNNPNIRMIKKYPNFTVQRCIPTTNLNNVTLSEPETDEIVGIFDSGTDHSFVNKYKLAYEKFFNHKSENKNHGTFVISRVLFGENIFEKVSKQNPVIQAIANYADFQVLYYDPSESMTKLIDLDSFKKAINKVFNKYKDITIFNLSINELDPIENGNISELTEFLDIKCREHDITLICSAGNHEFYQIETNYNNVFNSSSYNTAIASPADALNVVTVGSISNKIIEGCYCVNENYPSPFTRKGPVHFGWRKPELVSNGGNILVNSSGVFDDAYWISSNNSVGVEGLDTAGLAKDVGTSQSAPSITRQSIYASQFIKKSNLSDFISLSGNRSNLIKALLVHSTGLISQTKIRELFLRDAYGYGIPNIKKVIENDSEDEITIIYTDSINSVDKLHKLRFTIPEYLLNTESEFILTFVYNPPVDKNFANEYSLIQLTASLRNLVPTSDNGNFAGAKINNITPVASDWHSYKTRQYNVSHFKKITKKIETPFLEVLIQMYLSDKYSEPIEEASQPYALILTIRDTMKKNRLKSEISASNQFNLVIENKVEIQAQV